MHAPTAIRIREVTPRDGLQSEPTVISTEAKVDLANRLSRAGFAQINVGSFVSPQAVPQMADSAEVLARIERRAGVVYDVSVPNERGAEAAVQHGADAVSVFVSASDEASRKNVRRGREEAFVRAEQAIRVATAAGLPAVGTLANAFGSPYGDVIDLGLVLRLATRLAEAGVSTLALGDTSGEATPWQVGEWVSQVRRELPELRISLHLHDSRGGALANAVAAMDAGITWFDSALGGLGGSPFTKDAAGNLCTEDLVAMCERAGVDCGVSWAECVGLSRLASRLVGRELPGRSARLGTSDESMAHG
jgi:hydroxymethylglutaryl-CoA lyase